MSDIDFDTRKFCADCKHLYKPTAEQNFTKYLCGHPSNVTESRNDESGRYGRMVIKDLEKLNPDQDCSMWEPSVSHLNQIKNKKMSERERLRLLKELTAKVGPMEQKVTKKGFWADLFQW